MTIEELKNEAIQKANELTEQMLKEHQKKLNDLKKEYDEKIAKLQEEPKTGRRWKPEDGDRYYYVEFYEKVGVRPWCDSLFDYGAYCIGNVFKTREEAQFAIEQLKVLAELQEYADDDKEWNGDNMHMCIKCETNKVYVGSGYYYTRPIPFNLYFSSQEQAQKAIDAIGEERLKKYFFCVEE